jgi:hypothetical protein
VAGFIEVLLLKRLAFQIVFGQLNVSNLTPCEAKAERPFMTPPPVSCL